MRIAGWKALENKCPAGGSRNQAAKQPTKTEAAKPPHRQTKQHTTENQHTLLTEALIAGRVFLFLFTDDFWRDFHAYKGNGIIFVREPKEESYGTVAVFEDLYGNLWDLLELRTSC